MKIGIGQSRISSLCGPPVGQMYCRTERTDVYRANPAACEMFQRTEEEICQLGRPCVADINDPRLEPALEERRKQGKVRT